MDGWQKFASNKRALAYALFSAVVLAAMIAGGIIPERKQKAELEKEAASLQAQIEQQKIFQPIFQHLVDKRPPGQEKARPAALVKASQGLRFDIDTAPAVLTGIAGAPGTLETRFSPSPQSLTRDSDLLLIEGVLQGPYREFRAFLTGLATLPAFRAVESLEIRSTVFHPEYRLKIWVELDNY